MRWYAKRVIKNGTERGYTEDEKKVYRTREMIRCAKQWAEIHWPASVTVEILFGSSGAHTPYLNIDDPAHELTMDQATEFYEYMVDTFPDLIADVTED